MALKFLFIIVILHRRINGRVERKKEVLEKHTLFYHVLAV